MRFLIDECLTPQLAKIAQSRGYEASHVVWLARAGMKDWHLMPVIVEGDWTFVTRNAFDFRGRADKPGEPGLYARTYIHAGLICMNSASPMILDDQEAMFEMALDELRIAPDLVNEVLEVTLVRGHYRIVRYSLPA